MFQILLVVELLVALALVFVILIQRSEGGALGIGGGPGGMMSARGAANLLTRATTVLAILFIGVSLALSIVAGGNTGTSSVTDTLVEGGEEIDPLAVENIVIPGEEETTEEGDEN